MRLKVPPVLVFGVTAFLMWIISEYLPKAFLGFSTAMWVIYLVASVGLFFGVLGVVQFASNKTTVNPHKPENSSSVVKNGVYKYTRNPMYLGLLIVLISCAIYFGSGYSLLMIPIFIWYMNTYQIKPEEEMLVQLFGDEYRGYKQKVRRWI